MSQVSYAVLFDSLREQASSCFVSECTWKEIQRRLWATLLFVKVSEERDVSEVGF